ncbi:hypothetical protein E2C01_035907 [Portunus trituberculatus]|uniref:Uncharacterized protein n=1 Tax=Portunus trituberculatus TaxID=210409 RepID=A0A5B7FAZ1_PORTR|nr:hypothetical protein [Portunus trituberculatus]
MNRDPPKRKCLCRFASTSCEDLRRYYVDFPWNDYCFRVRDPSLCAERLTESRKLAKGNNKKKAPSVASLLTDL